MSSEAVVRNAVCKQHTMAVICTVSRTFGFLNTRMLPLLHLFFSNAPRLQGLEIVIK